MIKMKSAIRAGVVAALMAVGSSYAATIATATRDFALETAQTTTVWTMPVVVYTMGVPANQDFYITYTLTNGVFTAAPTATASAVGGTATLVAGGTGANNVTFRINGSSAAQAAGDTITLNAFTATTAAVGTAVTVNAANGLLFIGGAVASPLEAVTFAAGGDVVATFTQAITFTMAVDSDPIDLNPTPASNSRKVFGPAAQLDLNTVGAVGTVDDETATRLLRVVLLGIGAQLEPNGATAFGNTIDSLTVQLGGGFNTTGIASLCYDFNVNGLCDAGEGFSLTTGSVTVAAATWAACNCNLILDKTVGAIFDPRTLGLNFTLNVATNAIRPGMTAHPYVYTGVVNNNWPIQYANGTLLRSSWFTYDPATNTTSTLRLVNAALSSIGVVSTQYFPDGGTSGSFATPPADIPAQQGRNYPLNPTTLPNLGSTSPSNRAFIEVILAGDLASVDGSIITFNTASGTRTVTPMRNVTFDSGVRSNAPF